MILAASCCMELSHLEVSGVVFNNDIFRDCLGNMVSFKSLSLNGILILGVPGYSALADGVPPGLESLSLEPWNHEHEAQTEEDVQVPMRDAHLLRASTQISSLRVLRLRGCSILTDASIGPALTKFSNLEVLDLSFCTLTTDTSVCQAKSERLKVLVMDLVPGVSDFSVVPIVERNRNLEELGLRSTGVSVR